MLSGELPPGHSTAAFRHGAHSWCLTCGEGKGAGTSIPKDDLRWSSLMLEGEMNFSDLVIILLCSALLLQLLGCSNSQTQQKPSCYHWEKG